jgi:D-aminopeptidase
MITLYPMLEAAMATTGRVRVTRPLDLIEGIDRLERNRSRFIAEAVEHESSRRRRDGLLLSLKGPHPATVELAEMGMADWAANLPVEEERLVDVSAGTPVRWIEGQGWIRSLITRDC